TEEVKKQREEDQEEIKRITEKADKMIRGATVAGLAYSLDRARAKYSRYQILAGFTFYVSIVILFYVAWLLAEYSIPGFSFPLSDSTSDITVANAEITLSGILARLVLLLPAIWLTVFSSRKYRIL